MTPRKWTHAAIAAVLAASGLSAQAEDRTERGEAELTQLLAGRTAGEPVRCLGTTERRSMRVIDGTALVFEDGDTVYVNRPSGARFLGWSDIPVFHIWGSQLCARDHVQLHDSASLIPGPVLIMDEFVPYRRAT